LIAIRENLVAKRPGAFLAAFPDPQSMVAALRNAGQSFPFFRQPR
jgi:hypothetical protein